MAGPDDPRPVGTGHGLLRVEPGARVLPEGQRRHNVGGTGRHGRPVQEGVQLQRQRRQGQKWNYNITL